MAALGAAAAGAAVGGGGLMVVRGVCGGCVLRMTDEGDVLGQRAGARRQGGAASCKRRETALSRPVIFGEEGGQKLKRPVEGADKPLGIYELRFMSYELRFAGVACSRDCV